MVFKMNVCFYSAVEDDVLFERVGFYRDDIAALKEGGGQVFATKSLRELFRSRPEMIVSYFYTKSVFAALFGRLVGARVILTGGADQISPVLLSGGRLFVRRVFAFFCLVLAHRILVSCTNDLINFKRLCFGLKFLEKKLELENHVVIPSPLPRVVVDRLGQFDAFTLCWMGTISNVRRKGVDRAVRLIGLLRKIGVDASLNVAGSDGPGRIFIENLIKELNLVNKVHLIGPISEEEKNRRFAEGQVYLQLSEYEGFGVAAAEAFFSGMIVVHSNIGGLRDVIGKRGLILSLAMIDEGNVSAVDDFYSSFLRYKVDEKYLANSIEKYSIKSRSNAFFR
ncbi:MAG: glycosyltransferase family 4 protein [Rhodoferax sp.]